MFVLNAMSVVFRIYISWSQAVCSFSLDFGNISHLKSVATSPPYVRSQHV